MIGKKNSLISKSFPDQLASDSEKAQMEFGLQVGQAIEHEWFRSSGGSCRYYNQWTEFHKLRLYSRGEQSVAKYKNELAVDGDLSYLNLDWTPVPIIPKFVDIVVNGMADRMFKVKAQSQDPISADRRSKFQEMVEADMIAKEMLDEVKANFGVDAFNVPQDDVPMNQEEMNLYMQLNYKPAIEIAAEQAIDTVLKENNYDNVRTQFDTDLTVLGIGAAKHSFSINNGIKVEYVDPANLIYSYTESPTFNDAFYFGEVKNVHITELKKIDPTLTKQDLEEIRKVGSGWWDKYPAAKAYRDDLFAQDTIPLLFFSYKTDKKFVYKKKYLENGGERVIEKDDSFEAEGEEGRFERIEKRIDVWYDGVMVLGGNKMLKWELQENMVRPKSASQYSFPTYIVCAPKMYKGTIESLVRRMITFADLIQITHLKLQQVIAKIVPDGVYIDADGLNEVDLGNGANYNPEDALKLYFQTGSVIGRSFTQEGEFNNARVPIQELNGNAGQAKIASLVNTYNHYMSMLRDVTGLNEARDGSVMDKNSLVGLQKLAAANSNTATRHILLASLDITKRMAECLSLRISDVIEYADFGEEFAMQIGKYNVATLDELDDLYMYDFGIFIELSPDEEQKQMLENNINIALQRDQITLEDAIDIRQVQNVKLANELLKMKRRRKDEKDREYEKQKAEYATQLNIQQSQAAAQAAAQKAQMEAQAKAQIEQLKGQMEMQKLQLETEMKMKLMEQEFQYNIQLSQMNGQILTDRDKMKEGEKKNRQDRNNSQQSKLIDQRQGKKAPVNFESSNDHLTGGAGLGEFEPR